MDSSFLSSPIQHSPAQSDGWSDTLGHDNSVSTTATSVASTPSRYPSKPDHQQEQQHLPLSPLSQTSSSTSPIPSPPTCHKCSSLLPTTNTDPLSCGHTTCLSCIHTAAMLSLISAATGADFLPAECCPSKPFPLATIGKATSLPEFIAYRDRLAERKMAPDRRVYCADEGCRMFISEGRWRRRTGRCPLCWGNTCLGCGRRGHRGACSTVKGGKGRRRERPGKVSEWLRGVRGEEEG